MEKTERRVSFCSLGDMENIKVYLRIRPFIDREDNKLLESGSSSRNIPSVLEVLDPGSHPDAFHGTAVKISTINRALNSNSTTSLDGEIFTFDAVGGPKTEQNHVFSSVAKQITENCLQGYNGTIFAYGQTGSGKTFTMQGPLNEEDGSIVWDQRGLIPRTFEYLFDRIREEERRSNGTITYFCKCSFVEIYNETIYDLLVPEGPICTLREDVRRGGVFVEGCREELLSSSNDAFSAFDRGSLNRHVAETSMNRESSRSHSVFTIFLQSRKVDGRIVDIRESRFNLVDLAGSERQQHSGASGIRLKEAGNINKSLLALSNVINALVDSTNGKPRHVHYRDSKLTFLLRDSLGGNAKTIIIAAVSPSPLCQAETLSTLRFAQRAKQIKNKAIVNKDIQGNVVELQAEVRKLRGEVLLLRAGKETGLTSSNNSIFSSDTGDNDLLFMLQMTMERQAEIISELTKKQQQVDLLEESLKRKDQQLNSERMVAKFRESTIKTLSSKIADPSTDLLSVFEVERNQYRQEISELKKQIEHHPDVTKFAYESMMHRDKLKKFDNFVQAMEKHDETIAKYRKFHDLLLDRNAKLESQLKTFIEKSEIPVQNISLIEKDHSHQDEMIAKILKEKADLESKYEDLILEQELLRKEIEDLKINVDELPHGNKRSKSSDDIASNDEFINIDDTAHQYEEKISLLEKENISLLGQVTELNEQIKIEKEATKTWIYKYEDTRNSLSEEVNALTNCLSDAQGDLQKLKDHLRNVTLEKDSIQAKLHNDLESIKKVMENVKTQHKVEVERLLHTEQKLKENLEHATVKLKNTTDSLSEADSQIYQLKGQIEELQKRVTENIEKLRAYSPIHTYGDSVSDIITRIRTSDENQQVLLQRLSRTGFALNSAQQDNEELKAQIVSLKEEGSLEKIAALNTEISRLQNELVALHDEVSTLRRENDKLIQHSNMKQKLQYHLQIKEENNHFREEIRELREEIARLTQRNLELEDVHGHLKARHAH